MLKQVNCFGRKLINNKQAWSGPLVENTDSLPIAAAG